MGSSITRLRDGHAAAAARNRELMRAEGPRGERAVREAFSAFDALVASVGLPVSRDPVSQRAVERLRERWTLIEKRARAGSRR